LAGTASIFMFDMYYKCTASVSTSYVALVFAISNQLYVGRIDNLSGAASGNPTPTYRHKIFSRGLTG